MQFTGSVNLGAMIKVGLPNCLFSPIIIQTDSSNNGFTVYNGQLQGHTDFQSVIMEFVS